MGSTVMLLLLLFCLSGAWAQGESGEVGENDITQHGHRNGERTTAAETAERHGGRAESGAEEHGSQSDSQVEELKKEVMDQSEVIVTKSELHFYKSKIEERKSKDAAQTAELFTMGPIQT